MTSEAEDQHIMMLQFSKNMGIADQSIDIDEIEWWFLTEMLGWNEGIPEVEELQQQKNSSMKTGAVTLLAEHMFLTEQMGWKKA